MKIKTRLCPGTKLRQCDTMTPRPSGICQICSSDIKRMDCLHTIPEGDCESCGGQPNDPDDDNKDGGVMHVHKVTDLSSVAACGFDPSYKPHSASFFWKDISCPKCLKKMSKRQWYAGRKR